MRFRNSKGRHTEYEAQLSATLTITLLTNILVTLDSQEFEKTLDLQEVRSTNGGYHRLSAMAGI